MDSLGKLDGLAWLTMISVTCLFCFWSGILVNGTVDVDDDLPGTETFEIDGTEGTVNTTSGPVVSDHEKTDSPWSNGDEEPTGPFETEEPVDATGVPSNGSHVSDLGQGTEEPRQTPAAPSDLSNDGDNAEHAVQPSDANRVPLNFTEFEQEAEDELSNLGEDNTPSSSTDVTTTESPTEKAIPNELIMDSSKGIQAFRSTVSPFIYMLVLLAILGMFDELDIDKDDQLSRQELLQIIPEKFVGRFIDAVDANNDQYLDRDELRGALEESQDHSFDDDISALVDDDSDTDDNQLVNGDHREP